MCIGNDHSPLHCSHQSTRQASPELLILLFGQVVLVVPILQSKLQEVLPPSASCNTAIIATLINVIKVHEFCISYDRTNF